MKLVSEPTPNLVETECESAVTSGSSECDVTSTKCAVHPVILTPASSACRWAWVPLNSGNRAGWMLMSRPRHNLTNSPVKILMKPAKHTISTPDATNSECIAISNSRRDLYAVWAITCWENKHFIIIVKTHSHVILCLLIFLELLTSLFVYFVIWLKSPSSFL